MVLETRIAAKGFIGKVCRVAGARSSVRLSAEAHALSLRRY